MKTMISSIILASCLVLPLASCSDDDAVLEQKDWSTTSYFSSTDETAQGTYYKPAVGYVGDPMPFYDPVAGDFKIMYLQDFRPNPAGTYHPIWAVSTKDAANYESLGELVSCGNINEQDAAIGTGSTIYDESSKLYYTSTQATSISLPHQKMPRLSCMLPLLTSRLGPNASLSS